MTISNPSTRKLFTANGVQTLFPIDFAIFKADEVKVKEKIGSGLSVVKVQGVDYQVINIDPATESFDIDYSISAAPLDTTTIAVFTNFSDLQPTDYQENDAFPAETHERALDRLARQVAQKEDSLLRTIVADETITSSISLSLPVPSANQFLAWNAAGDALINATPLGGSVTVTPAAATVLDDLTVADMLVTLGVADDTLSVHKAGAETITGAKKFTANPTLEVIGGRWILNDPGALTGVGIIFQDGGINRWDFFNDGTVPGDNDIRLLSVGTSNGMRIDGFGNANFISTPATGAISDNGNLVYSALNPPVAVGAASINQAALKTAQSDVSTTLSKALLTLPGGEYGFYPRIKNNVTGVGKVHASLIAGIDAIAPSFSAFTQTEIGTTFLTRIALGTDTGTISAQQRHVQASPDWDLGDGLIPLFVFIEVDSAGKIVNISISPDPVWAYQGPTFNTRRPMKYVKDTLAVNSSYSSGLRVYTEQRAILAEFGTIKAAIASGLTRIKVLKRLATDPIEDLEITQSIKNRDMNSVAPFGNPTPGNTIVMLDPVSPLMQRLLYLHQCEDQNETVNDWLMNKNIVFGNKSLNRITPTGIMAVSVKLV